MEQGKFEDIEFIQEQVKVKVLRDELDRLCKLVAYTIKNTELALLNDVSPQAISKMLNTNGEQTPFGKDYIPSIAIKNPEYFMNTVGKFFCDLCGYELPEKKRSLTDEERLKLLTEKLREMKLDKHEDLKDLL